MCSLVISTILQNRSLHNVHNVLIVNLMVADIVAIIGCAFQNIGMTVSYIICVQDPFRCDMLIFFFFPINVIMYTFVILSVEKFIAIKYALRHRAIVTHHRVYQVIAAGWIIIPLFSFTGLMQEKFVGTEYDKLSRSGFCLYKQASFIGMLFSRGFPIFLAFFITITLDVYLSIKAYQVYRKFKRKMERINRHLRINLTKCISSSSQ